MGTHIVSRTSGGPSSEGRIFFSPLIDYAAHPVHSAPDKVVLRGHAITFSVVLQLRVRPGFSVHPSTINKFSPHPKQAAYKGKEEWFTNRHGSAVFYRLLIKDNLDEAGPA